MDEDGVASFDVVLYKKCFLFAQRVVGQCLLDKRCKKEDGSDGEEFGLWWDVGGSHGVCERIRLVLESCLDVFFFLGRGDDFECNVLPSDKHQSFTYA